MRGYKLSAVITILRYFAPREAAGEEEEVYPSNLCSVGNLVSNSDYSGEQNRR